MFKCPQKSATMEAIKLLTKRDFKFVREHIFDKIRLMNLSSNENNGNILELHVVAYMKYNNCA